MNQFIHTMLVRAFRDDKTVLGISELINAWLGRSFVEFPPLDLDSAFKDSAPIIPIIFILSTGADPLASLLRLAQDRNMSHRLRTISLRQGQGPIAERMIDQGRINGDWVCLQNCHLATSWMPTLERIMEEIQHKEIHPEFRLWLTSMPSPKFPVPVLQSGIKLTNEPPRGIKANITRSFYDVSQEMYDGCTKDREWKKMLFGLCFVHAVLLERKKFGAVGFNVPYPWNTSNLEVSIKMLKQHLEEQADIPFGALVYLVGVVNYGGRVTDLWDARCVESILHKFILPEILEDSYQFDESGVYFAPGTKKLAETRAFLDKLPLNDSPGVFGLHENADMVYQQLETKVLIETIINVQPRVSSGAAGMTPDEEVKAVSRDILSKLPTCLSEDKADAQTFVLGSDGNVNSMGSFLQHELERFHNLLQVMRRSLDEMDKAIQGLVVMSGDLESMYNSMLVQKVPVMWETAAYPSLKPLGTWTSDLLLRMESIQKWVDEGPQASYWMSGFFYPQGFLTGVLQSHSRQTEIAIDTLRFHTDVVGDKKAHAGAPASGVHIHGLVIDGAQWDSVENVYAESTKGVLYTEMPAIWLNPVSVDIPMPTAVYETPVHKTATRAGVLSTTGQSTNYVLAIHPPSKHPQDHWIRRGVALLCQTPF